MSEVRREEQITKDLLKVKSGGQVGLHRWDRSLLTGSLAAEVTAAAFRACLSTRDGLCEILISHFLIVGSASSRIRPSVRNGFRE